MRYVGLTFLGLALWSSQAWAEKFLGTAAVKIVAEGKIIHRSTVDPLSLLMKVIHEDKYFICVDRIFEDRVYLNCDSLEDK